MRAYLSPVLLVGFVLLGFFCLPAVSDTWDAAASFNTTSPASGPWSYGFYDRAWTFSQYTACTTPTAGFTLWTSSASGGIGKNQTGGSLAVSGGTVPAGKLAVYPTNTWDRQTLHWTAPATMAVRLQVAYSLLDNQGGMGGYVTVNRGIIYQTVINSSNPSPSYSATVLLQSGDVVDFLADRGPDNWYGHDFCTISATVTTVPDFGSATGRVSFNVPGSPGVSGTTVASLDGFYSTKTASDGTYSLNVPAGTYTLVASGPGYPSSQVSGVAIASGAPTSCDFALAAGYISGAVFSSATGNPAIAGCTVVTGGNAYSGVTAGDGSYFIVVPIGTYTLTAGKRGFVAQQVTGVTATGGAPATRNFALTPVASSAGSVLTLPGPSEWATAPSGAPAPPGDAFAATFADSYGVANPSAPAIAEWARTVKPGESFTISGVRFTSRTGVDAGTDTTVWVWADTPSGGVLRQAKLWKVTDLFVTATMPDDIPFGMFLVWVENENGASTPVCINRTQPEWIGPLGNTAQPGVAKRVIGKNMSYGRGSETSYVYIQPAAGGPLTQVTVTKVEPYSVWFTVPSNLTNGNYRIYVHNGQGGHYGWGDPLDLIIQSAWQRGSAAIDLTPSPTGDDTSAIQNAINTLTAQPNGGTLKLSAGTFRTYDQMWVKENVRVLGAGMNSTTWEFRTQYGVRHDFLRYIGNHVAFDSLTIKACVDSQYIPTYGIIEGPYPDYSVYSIDDFQFLNLRLTSDTGLLLGQNQYGAARTEIANCELNRTVTPGTVDGWCHNNNFRGGPYACTGMGFGFGTTSILEYNYVETPAWPVNPLNGSRNYMDFLTYDQYKYLLWAARIAMPSANSTGGYVAWTTSKDVAINDNQGEMILFHGYGGAWFGQIASASGTTVTVRTDGLVDGQSYVANNYSDWHINSSSPIPDTYVYGLQTDGTYMTIIAGPGLGQSRKILSHTWNSVTLDSPWRIPPDSTSRATIAPLYRDQIMYKNDLNAFPVGYVQHYSASCGPDIDGNGWMIDAEGNVSRHNRYCRSILGNSLGVTSWCTMRDEQSLDANDGGANITDTDLNNIGYVVFGNAYRNCTFTVGTTPYIYVPMTTLLGPSNILENSQFVNAQAGFGAGEEGLYRNNNVNVRQSSQIPKPVTLPVGANPILVNNTYSGWTQTYYPDLGCTFAQKPIAQYRVARFQGYVDVPMQEVAIPIANAGIVTTLWTATPSDPWITAVIQNGNPLAAESDLGQLLVSVDTTGMGSGKHWGSVTINAGGQIAKVGVCADLSDAIPTTGLKLWLKGDAGISKDGSNSVSTWADQSGSGNDVAQLTSAYQPSYVAGAVSGFPAVRFHGAADVLRSAGLVTSGAGGFTTFTVAKPSSLVSLPQTLFWQGDASSTAGYGAYVSGAPSYKAGWGSASAEVTDSAAALSGVWRTVETRYDGAAGQLFINGAPKGSAAKTDSNFASGVFSLGNYGPSATQGLNGVVAEVIVYDRALSDIERSWVEAYLRGKYGLPTAQFTAAPTAGIAPAAIAVDASASTDASGGIVSYVWDFGDYTSGTGTATSHHYTIPGTYTISLTVTNAAGASDSARQNVVIAPPITSLVMSGSPLGPVDVNTPVTLTATVGGGYQVQFKFLYKDGTGWHTLRDYASVNTCTWTPSVAGYYELKVYARSSISTSAYDIASNVLSYPVGLLPTGMKLWLKADAGVTLSGSGVTAWSDQSGSGFLLSQTNPSYMPAWVDGVQNGHPIVRFQGPNQCLQATSQVLNGGTAFSTFTTTKLNSIPSGNSQYLFWNGADSIPGGYGAYLYTTGGFRVSWGSGSAGPADANAATIGTWYRISSRFNSSTGQHEWWSNGNLIGTRTKSGSNLSGGTFSVGNFGPSTGYGLYGDIGEIMIYDRSLTDTERSNVESYMQARWSPQSTVPIDRLRDVKALGDGVLVSISSAKVATSSSGTYLDGCVYVTESDRTCGMKITGAGPVYLWDNVTLSGTTDTDAATGERVLRVSSVSKATGTELNSLGMSGKSLAASGQLVRVWGKVKEKTASYLTIDDGSGVTVKVEIDGLATPITVTAGVGDYVSARGPAGCMAGGVVAVRVRSASDIVFY